MHYLICGGAGFIGSNLVERLLQEDYSSVTVLDNFSTGKIENIRNLLLTHPDRLQIFNGDVTDGGYIQEILENTPNPDVIFNLACPASPVHYQREPIKTTLTSVLGTYNLLSLASETKATLFQASTSEVYGNPDIHPQPESYWGNCNSFGPRSCYDEGKRCAESLCYDWQQNGVDLRIVRIFNTYGPNMTPDDGRVVSNFIIQALQHKDITIYGTGKQTRSFCYIDDLLDGFIKVLHSDVKSPINLGNPGEYEMLELAEKIIKITNSNSKLSFNPLPKDDPERRKPDITLAKNMGWEPKVNLDDGLMKTINYFKRFYDSK